MFSDPLQIETALLETEAALPEIETALPDFRIWPHKTLTTINYKQLSVDKAKARAPVSGRGVYSVASQKNISPPPSKILPCFVDFLQSFKLHKGFLTFFLFSSFPFHFSLSPPSNSSLSFNLDKKMARIYIPVP